ncbi:sensor histidine kinase [Agromyces sp. MMS24-K17]|uniref:sensor histidine kinase n=1 Tax=Agromyces sp. MMS24-K17 TaxID=3372850 RepID=UPI0037549403
MPHSTLTPVFVGLRTGLHLLVAAMLGLVVVRLLVTDAPGTPAGLVLCVAFAVVYGLGAWIRRVPSTARSLAAAGWIAALTAIWIALVAGVPDAAYLVFPLFFLYLHVLPRAWGPIAVLAATVVAVVALGLHGGFTVGGVVGPFVGAAVALLIGLGYRALAREAAEREAMLAELVATRDRLAATEREQGRLAERARLAREIHDTVAQGLSSIQMLLHAAERADGERPGIEHVRLARATAAEGLADTRRFIREWAPPSLEDGLGAALRRLGGAGPAVAGLEVEVDAPDAVDLPMPVQSALLRIAQGAVANVVQHARATRAGIRLDVDGDRATLGITDDGVGFDPGPALADRTGSDSFGLRAIAERTAELGGDLRVDSAPGHGTTLTVTIDGSRA